MLRLFVNNANMMQLGMVMNNQNQAYIVVPLSKL